MSKIIPQAHYYLKWSKGQTRQIYIRIRSYEQYVTKATGVRVNVKDWSSKKEEVLSGDPLCRQKNGFLSALRIKVEGMMLENAQGPNPDSIRDILNGGRTRRRRDSEPGLMDYMKTVNERRYRTGEISYTTMHTAQSYIAAIGRCLEADGRTDVRVSDMSSDMMKGIIQAYIESGHQARTAKTILQPLKEAAKEAMKEGYITAETMTGITDARMKERRREETATDARRKYLTEAELKKLEDYYSSASMTKGVRKSLEVFLFSVYECGLRFSDMMTLRWSNIDFEKKTLTKMMMKTGKTITIPLTRKAEEMLLKRRKRAKGPYVFEMLTPDEASSQEKLCRRRNVIEKVYYVGLNNAGRKAGLDMPLSMHMARHTFATIMANRGVQTSIISKLLGHSSTAVTETYAEILEPTLRKALDMDG